MRFDYNPKETFYTFYLRKDTSDYMIPCKCAFGELLLGFLELDFKSILNNFPYDFLSNGICYEVKPNKFCKKYLSQINDRSMLLTIIEQSNEQYLKYFRSCSSPKYAIPYKKHIKDFFDTLESLQEDLSKYILTGTIDNGSMLEILEYTQNINVSFRFIESTHEIYSVYEINNIHSIVYFDLINCISKGIKIKQCENCHNFFIPKKRSDEIYCDRILKNNKTCKQIGYEEKAKSDPFMQAYTKARKTQHARIRYNSHIENYKEKHYEPWKKSAEKARDSFKENNDIDGFLKWLDDNKNSF